MTTAADLELLEPGDLAWPCTYIWRISAAWGMTQTEMTVDCPVISVADDVMMRFGELLYGAVIAPAIGASSLLQQTICWRWKAFGPPLQYHQSTPPGQLFGAPAARSETPTLMLHSGHHDKLAMKPLYFPGAPASMSVDGLLTYSAMQFLEAHASSFVMGMMNQWLGGPLGLLNRYSDILAPSIGNPFRVGFRRVNYIRVLQYTERAPDLSAGI